MLPKVVHLYGPLWIRGYGLIIALGFAIFLYLLYNNPIRKKIISNDNFFNVIFVGLLAGIIGGRLLNIIENFSEFKHNIFESIYPWIGGFSVLGSIVVGIASISIYLKIKKVQVFKMLDITAIYAPLLHAFGRLGCLMAGCCYGIPHKKSWFTITFTNPDGLAPLHMPLIPTQLLSSIVSFSIFLFLYWLYKRNLTQKTSTLGTGIFLLAYVELETFSRFIVDFLRGNRVISEFIANYTGITFISTQQVIAFSIIFLTPLILFFGYHSYKKKNT